MTSHRSAPNPAAIRAAIDAQLNWLANPAHARWLESHTDDLIAFASGGAIDAGFGYLDGDGEVIDRGGEAWLQGAHIPEYLAGTWNNHSPRRKRKLLLHRHELERLAQRTGWL